MKTDPYRSKEVYVAWKRGGARFPGVSPASAEVLGRYLQDMEQGLNIAKGSRKGGRSYLRLNTLRWKLAFLAREVARRFAVSLLEVSEEQLHAVFAAMRSGELEKRHGGAYRSTADYVKVFRAFWHWHMKVERKQGRTVTDICAELDDSREKPPWVYLREEEVRRLCSHARFKYKVLVLFLFDTGIRSPSELVNVRLGDFSENYSRLRIRDETSKTFGRTINLLLSADVVREYVRERALGEADALFPFHPAVVNRYLRRLATQLFGPSTSPGGAPYSELSMYDLRHSSACYWLPRYKSESALKYRFGWRRSEMIHYYTEFLGMEDTITEEDLCTESERSAAERRIDAAEREKRRLEEELAAMQAQMQQILGVVNRLVAKGGIEAKPDTPPVLAPGGLP